MILWLLSIFDEISVTEYTFGVVSAGLVEAIHVELSNEAINFVVAEVTWQYHLLKFSHIFDHEL